MNILLVHEIFVTPNEGGGGTRHYEFAKFLVKHGHNVTVIASNVDYLSGKKRRERREIKDGINIIYVNTIQSVHKSFLLRGFVFLLFAISSFFKTLEIKNIDIIIGTSPPLFQAFTSLLAAKIKKKIYVYEVRDLWLDFAKELGVIKNNIILQILRWMEKILYKKSDLIIINSPGFKPYILHYVPETKIVLIPNGVNTEDFDVLPKKKGIDLKNKIGLNNKFVVMYAGNLGVANDIDNIITTANYLKKYKDIVFVLIGGGIKKEKIKAKIKNMNLENTIVLDPVVKSQMSKFLSVADVCLATIKNIPLLQIVYPNKVFDYMAAGKPTIVTIGGPIKDIIEKSPGGVYVPPGDPIKLGNAIIMYYNNREIARKHGENARIYVKTHFERKIIAEKLEMTLLNLLKKKDR